MANNGAGVAGALQVLFSAAAGIIGLFLVFQEGVGPILNNGIFLILLGIGGFVYLHFKGSR